MYMHEFPANSQKAKARPEEPKQDERPKQIERVTSGEAVRRPRGLGRRFKETFIGGNARIAVQYMTAEVIIPAVRDTVAEALQSGIEKLIYGDTRPRKGPTPSYSNVGHVNYQQSSQRMSSPATRPNTSTAPRMLSRRARTRQEFDEIVIPSRQEAEEVIDQMFDILSRYGSVSVADLYELTGIQSAHTDHKWGWTELRGAKAARLRSGGFLLDLPEPEPLD
jgi:hypothetical protein